MESRKTVLAVVLGAVYCTCIVVSNIIVNKPLDVLGVSVNTAMVLFPVSYIVNDVTVEVFGYRFMRALIWTGFACALIAVLAFSVTLWLPGAPGFEGQQAFETVLGSVPRALAASLCGYLVGSTANAKVMTAMKRKFPGNLAARCIASTAVGETLDALVFVVLAFSFVLPVESMVSLVVSAAVIKTGFETVVYPATKRAVLFARRVSAQ